MSVEATIFPDGVRVTPEEAVFTREVYTLADTFIRMFEQFDKVSGKAAVQKALERAMWLRKDAEIKHQFDALFPDWPKANHATRCPVVVITGDGEPDD